MNQPATDNRSADARLKDAVFDGNRTGADRLDDVLDASIERHRASQRSVFETFLDDGFIKNLQRQANLLATSGLYYLKCCGGARPPSNEVQQKLAIAEVFARIQTGAEYGLAPTAALREIYIVEGQPCFSAKLMAALLKRSGKFRYKVKHRDRDHCVIAFFELLDGKWEHVGDSTWTMEEASQIRHGSKKLTEKDNWRNYPSDMLFARAMSRGCRMYAPEVFMGSVYTVDEAEEISPESAHYLAETFGTESPADIRPTEPNTGSAPEAGTYRQTREDPNTPDQLQGEGIPQATKVDEPADPQPDTGPPGPEADTTSVDTRGGKSDFLGALMTEPAIAEGKPLYKQLDDDGRNLLSGLKQHRGTAKTIMDGLDAGVFDEALYQRTFADLIDGEEISAEAEKLCDLDEAERELLLKDINRRIDEGVAGE